MDSYIRHFPGVGANNDPIAKAVQCSDTMRILEQQGGKCEIKKGKMNDHWRRLVTAKTTKAYFLGF
jgi:hypothetical protein